MNPEREPCAAHIMSLLVSRRALLVSGVAFVALAPASVLGRPGSGPPLARATDFSEVIHGVRIADPYRWMENPSDPGWRPFIEGQGAYARATLDSIPGRAALFDRISELTAHSSMANQIQTGGGRYFMLARPSGSPTLCLLVRDAIERPDRILLDPNSLARPGQQAGLDYFWRVSPDGRYVVCGVIHGGSENTVLRVVDVESGALLPDRIDRANFASPQWDSDSSGFFYNRLAPATETGTAPYEGSVGRFHRLGDDPALDVAILGRGVDPAMAVADMEIPMLRPARGTDHLIGALYSGVDQSAAFYIASASAARAGRPRWRKLCDGDDGVTSVIVWRDALYMLTNAGAPRYRVVRTSPTAPDFGTAQEVVPEGAFILQTIAAARDAVYIMATDGGVHRLLALTPGGVREVALPFEGTFPWGCDTDPDADGAWLALQSWVRPQTGCHARVGEEPSIMKVTEPPPADLSLYAFDRVEVPARDGARVPLSIIYPKAVVRDGSAPLLMTAYGSYGVTLEPRYTPADIAWLEQGGVLAVAHVRGGGARGEEWHKAGYKASKPNSWRDLIDCGRWLIDQGWTSSGKLAIQGKSAGGIVVGRALTEAPETFGAVISRVGLSNALRSHVMPSGPANVPEYGSIEDPAEFRGLRAMDAYQHVRPGVDYPPVLLTVGLNDTLMMPWQPAKMAARLQAVSTSPALLRVAEDAGHGLGLTRLQEDREKADIFAFALWAAGHPDFQPPAGWRAGR